MTDYKSLYLKYKKKYINAKKIYGGENKTNLVEKLYNDEMEKLIKLKNTYEKKFNKGLTETVIFEFLDKIYKMGKNIEKKTQFSLDQQRKYLEKKNKVADIYQSKNFNDLLFLQLIREYLNKEDGNHINKLVKYLQKKGLKVDNKKLSKYKQGDLLGQGAFGAVYLLEDEKNKTNKDKKNKTNKDKKVLKIINASNYIIPKEKEVENWGEGVDQIVNEIMSMKKLTDKKYKISPDIHDYWISNKNNSLQVYIVMDYKGKPLTRWLYEKKRDLTKEEIDMIDKNIEKMHEEGITHRDLHSDNILVEEINEKPNEKPKFFITDFGLSQTKKTLFNKLKKGDYITWRPYLSEYDAISRYMELVIKVLNIKLIKK